MRALVTRKPFTHPTARPVATAAATAAQRGQPQTRSWATTTPLRLMTEPTERSMPPLPASMTMACPTAVAAVKENERATFIRLVLVRNRGETAATTATRTKKAMVMPNS